MNRPPAFGVGEASRTVTWAGRRVPLVIRYPAQSDGPGAQFATDAAPVSAIAFGHGFLAPAGSHASTLGRLAAAGFVVVAPDSERSYVPSHLRLAGDLRRALRRATSDEGGVFGGRGAVDRGVWASPATRWVAGARSWPRPGPPGTSVPACARSRRSRRREPGRPPCARRRV